MNRVKFSVNYPMYANIHLCRQHSGRSRFYTAVANGSRAVDFAGRCVIPSKLL